MSSPTGRQQGGTLDYTTAVLLAVAVLSGLAAVGGELLLRQGIGLVPPSVAVINASLAYLALAAAFIRGAVLRSRREGRELRRALEQLAGGAAILYPGLALVPPVEQWLDFDLGVAIEAVSKVLSLPLLIIGLVGLCWPPRLSKAQIRVLVADCLVGSLGLGVLWVIVVYPMAVASTDSPDVWAVLNATALLIGSVLFIVLVSASRRRASLPARQLWLLHGAIALPLMTSLGDAVVDATASAVTAVPLALLGYLAGGALVVAFCLQPSLQVEGLRESRMRELYAAVGPLMPVPVASLALVGTLVREASAPRPAEILGGVLLILLLLSVVVLRALASAELRASARQREGSKLTSSTEEEWFQVLVGRTGDLTLVLHRDGRILYATPSVHRATGMGPAELRGRLFSSLLSASAPNEQSVRALMAAADVLAGDPTQPEDLLMRGVSGAGREVEWQFTALVGLDIEGYLVRGRDVTDERRMRALLAESVSRDTLTGLHNRNGFISSTAERQGKRCVMVVNVRRFADFNDQYGHAVGDQVLRHVAGVLRDLPGPVSDPARLSADTFAVLVGGAVPDIEVVAAAASIRQALRMVSLPDGRPLPLDVAAGYAVSQVDDVPTAELLSQAELAVGRSRSLDRSPLVRYDPTLRLQRDAAATAEADLRSALRERALVVRYQPIVRLSDGAVVGAEALVRRVRADGSLESPEVFIPLAEQLGLVDEVDYAVLMRALGEMTEVARLTGRRLPVSVNISASELDDGLEHRVLDALSVTGWRAEDLVIEVTETALATRTGEASGPLRRLQRVGCQIAMDDFGTGYSSMASLVEMPVDIVKIDASFTHRLTLAGRGLSVMRAIVEIGRSLNLTTVAEGLSTVEQADLLRGMGCDRGQGFLYAPPLSVEDLIDFLRPDSSLIVME